MQVLALFGPTAVGKTGVAIAVAERLRERGEDPVAVNCDSIQVYRGLEVLSGAADVARAKAARAPAALLRRSKRGVQRRPLRRARPRRDRRPAGGGPAADRGRRHRPLPAGRAGRPRPASARSRRRSARRWSRSSPSAARRPSTPSSPRSSSRRSIRTTASGSRGSTELTRAGIEPARGADGLWTAELRHPTLLVGLAMDRDELGERIDARVDEMVAVGGGRRGKAGGGCGRLAHGAGRARLRGAPRWVDRSRG